MGNNKLVGLHLIGEISQCGSLVLDLGFAVSELPCCSIVSLIATMHRHVYGSLVLGLIV